MLNKVSMLSKSDVVDDNTQKATSNESDQGSKIFISDKTLENKAKLDPVKFSRKNKGWSM